MTNQAYPHLALLLAWAFWASGLSDAEARNRNKGRGSQIIGGTNNTIDPGGDRSVILGGAIATGSTGKASRRPSAGGNSTWST